LEVISIEKNEFFEVLTSDDRYMAKAVLIATGQPQKKLRIENLEAFEGRGVSYCTTCDGFGDYVVHEAMELLAFTKDITIYTNGNELQKNPYKKSFSKTVPARKLGIIVEGNAIVVDKNQQTNLFKQIATAVGQGALAGRKMIEYVRSLETDNMGG